MSANPTQAQIRRMALRMLRRRWRALTDAGLQPEPIGRGHWGIRWRDPSGARYAQAVRVLRASNGEVALRLWPEVPLSLPA